MKRLLCLCLLLLPAALYAGPSQVGGRVSPDGKEEITIDLPGDKQLHNQAGTDRAGLCVWTSLNHSAYWANVEELFSLQQYMRTQPGGGWPDRVDTVLAKIAPTVEYVQYTGTDPGCIKLALKTGRMPCVTYGYSPRYVGPRNPMGRISHMVNCVHLSDRLACVLDNNFVPDTPQERADPKTYEWMSPAEFVARWTGTDGTGWVVVPLHVGPPPIPVNRGVVGQCQGGVCRPPVAPAADAYEWRPLVDEPDQVALFKNGVQVGAYSHSRNLYRPYYRDGDRWGSACAPPIAPPPGKLLHSPCPCGPGCDCEGKPCRCRPVATAEPVEDFGVAKDKIHTDGYSVQGRRVTSDEAKKVLARGSTPLTDDSDKLRLTVIGTAPECSQVLNDLQTHPALAKLRDKVLVQSYRPGDWAVASVKLEHGGHPDIVVQEPPDAKGQARVLARLHDYQQGPEGLAGALRRADPNYDPHLDPSGKPQPTPQPAPPPDPPAASSWWQNLLASPIFWAAVSAIGGFLIRQFAPTLYPMWVLLTSRLQAPPAAPDNKVLTDVLNRLASRLDALEKPAQVPRP
jgi:hypothetical protein